MQKTNSRIKVLLLVFLLVFVGALYVVAQGILSNESAVEMNEPVSQEMTGATYEEQSPVMGEVEISISGTIIELTNESITVQEPERVVSIPGPTTDLNTSVTMHNSIVAKITSDTQYNNITQEELKVGDQVVLGAKQTSDDPVSYEAVLIEKNVKSDMETNAPEIEQMLEKTMEQPTEVKPSL